MSSLQLGLHGSPWESAGDGPRPQLCILSNGLGQVRPQVALAHSPGMRPALADLSSVPVLWPRLVPSSLAGRRSRGCSRAAARARRRSPRRPAAGDAAEPRAVTPPLPARADREFNLPPAPVRHKSLPHCMQTNMAAPTNPPDSGNRGWEVGEMKGHVCKIQIRKQIPAVFLISPSYFSGKNM